MGHRAASAIGALVLCLCLLAQQTPAVASAGMPVSGGGIVDGALGTTSQLGFTADSAGGSFLCVMAGRSGGFPFGPWQSISQMRVEGRVTPGSLVLSGGAATFSGTATIHVVGTTASGAVLTATVASVPFVSWQTAGGAGVARHRLSVNLPGLGWVDFGPAPLRAGHINIAN